MMIGQHLASRKRKAATVAAVLTALALGGGGMALATTNSLKSGTALTTSEATTAQVATGGFADVIERVRPTVVSVEVSRETAGLSAMDKEMPPKEFSERFSDERMEKWFRNNPGQRRDRHNAVPDEMKGAGSGFVIDAKGYVVTNNHVVEGASEIIVTLHDGKEHEASLIGRDPKTDLALIKIDADEDLAVADFGNSDDARVGDWVVTVGNPFGLDNTVTAGIISARGRSIGAGPYDDFLQIDAPINMGNSGGPAFNTGGEVIGVNTAIFSPSGGNVGIGFAIPASMVQEIIAELKTQGRVERGWLGVNIQAVTEDLADGFGLDEPKGAIVTEVVIDGPASDAGLKPGDVIIGVEGEAVEASRDLPRMIANLDAGQSTKMTIWREGEEQSITVKIGAYPDADQVASVDHTGEAAEKTVLGMGLAKVDPATRHSFSIGEGVEGVVITEVDPGSWAARKGISAGDVILKAGFEEVASPAEVAAAVKTAETKDQGTVVFLVAREAQERFVALPLRDA